MESKPKELIESTVKALGAPVVQTGRKTGVSISPDFVFQKVQNVISNSV